LFKEFWKIKELFFSFLTPFFKIVSFKVGTRIKEEKNEKIEFIKDWNSICFSAQSKKISITISWKTSNNRLIFVLNYFTFWSFLTSFCLTLKIELLTSSRVNPTKLFFLYFPIKLFSLSVSYYIFELCIYYIMRPRLMTKNVNITRLRRKLFERIDSWIEESQFSSSGDLTFNVQLFE